MKNKIKNLCGISTNLYDTLIECLINIYKGPIEKTIKEEFIYNRTTYPIIETGICEIIAGQTLNAINRQENTGEISLSSFTYKAKNILGDELIKQGEEKLAPFKKNYREAKIISNATEGGIF